MTKASDDPVAPLQKIVARLPLTKLSANQTFDVVCDIIAVILAIAALRFDLGPAQHIVKSVLILLVLGFIIWSFPVNSPRR